jgi:ferredoxin
MMKALLLILFFCSMFLQTFTVAAQQRFPKPEFESGHTQPPTLMPDPGSIFLEYLDVLVLVLALSIVTWLVLKKRSRRGVFWMSVFSLAYFGFFREGCVCSIGAIQNVTLALFHPGYKIPLTVIAFFVIPLIFTLFFGRTFCAGVCPLGAIQDLFVFRPKELKPWVQSMLGLVPYIYLGLAILYAATATDFVICRYDPFIGFFRLDATFFMFAIGGVFLLTGIFIARPYCRFFCPYGVLLNLMSRVSVKHLTITPSECIQCRLCESSCPFGAIQKPVSVKIQENRDKAVKQMMLISLLIPVLMLVGGWAGTRFHENLARVNPTVRLAGHLFDDEQNLSEATLIEVDAFKSSGKTTEALYAEAASIIDDFYWGGMLLGAFLGLVIGLTLMQMTRFYFRTDYLPDKGNCLSCARCIDYCPVDRDIDIAV